jgi:putative restriction endonuclease
VKNPGDINQNGQQILRLTSEKGTDHNARVWALKCRNCLHVYGSNSTDAWERKCPKCQKGTAGLAIPTERDGQNWTHEEHTIAFNLYNRIPFGQIHMQNPEVIELAAMLGRKVGSVSLKLSNFARLDPALQARGIKGMQHGAKGEEQIWHEFAKNPEKFAFESERLLADRLGQPIEEVADVDTDDLPAAGLEREATVRVRVNQSFFRSRILSAYNFRCCVTGLTIQPLLTASHIIPWAEDEKNRLNPKNGLCLNALHDRAFDRHLMWIEDGFVIHFSPRLKKGPDASKETIHWLTSFEGARLLLPKKFAPDPEFLKRHVERCLAKHSKQN